MITTISGAPIETPRQHSDAVDFDRLSARAFRELVEVLRLRNESFFVIEFPVRRGENVGQLLAELQGSGGRAWSLGSLGRNRLGILGQDTQSAECVQQWFVNKRSTAPYLRIFLHDGERGNRKAKQKRRFSSFRMTLFRDRGVVSCFGDGASSPQRAMVRKGLRRRRSKSFDRVPHDNQPKQWDAFSFGRQIQPHCDLYKIRTPLGKRCFDIIFAILGLVLASPLLCLSAALIKTTSRGPLFFVQDRVGHGGKPFRMYKFRTMGADADKAKRQLTARNKMNGSAFKLRDDPRVTWIGNWLRRFSIDELPQLWNVIRGDMSFVGPRPLPSADWNPQSVRELYRHDVVPGLTCIWQIRGRNDIAWEDWVRMDLFYVRKRCWILDTKILLATVPAVLSQRGAY